MKKILLFLSFLLMSIGIFGTNVTYIVTSTSAVSTTGTAPTGSSATYSQTYNTKCQMTGSNSATLTLTNLGGINISNLTLSMKSNKSSGAGKLKYSTDGGNTWVYLVGSSNSGVAFNNSAWNGSWSQSYTNISKSVSLNNIMQLTIIIEATANSLYCQSYSITYTPETAPSYTITEQSNNNSYGTVSLSGSVITGSPNSGYRYASTAYSVSPANSATVAQNGNEFTVTPSANTTVTINFEPIPTYTVKFINSGVVYNERPNIKEDSIITVFSTDIEPSEDCKNNGWEFIGWTETENGTTTVDSLKVTKNDTLYALYKLTDIGESYVTDVLTYDKIGLGYNENNSEQYKEFDDYKDVSNTSYIGLINTFRKNQYPDSSFIQMNTTHRPSGILSKTSSGKLHSIRVKWHQSTPVGRILEVHTNTSPYDTLDDVYANGNLDFEPIEMGVSDYVDLSNSDGSYIAIRPHSGVVKLDSIFITWKTLGSEPIYSTNQKCYDAGVSIVHWYKDSIKFGIDEIGTSTNVILYATNDTISEYTHIPDSSYKFAIQNIDTLKCTDLKFITTKSNGDECIRRYSIPIMIDSETNILCDSCDVAILSNGQLNIENDTVSGDVIIYEGGLLNVKSGNTYNVNSLTLRRDNDSVPCLSNNGTLSIADKLFFELRTDGSDWRWLSLPKTFNASDLKTRDEILLRYYDGEYRAHNRYGGWKNVVTENKTINAYEGLLFGITLDTDEKRIYRYELNKSVLSTEISDKNGADVTAYTDENTKPNNHGWNVVGIPYFDKYIPSYSDGSIRIIDNVVKYAVVPSKSTDEEIIAAGGYEEILLDGSYTLKPFTAFFIQTENTGTLSFDVDNKIKRLPKIQKDDRESLLKVNIDYKQMGIFINNDFTDEYELGNDLESMYSYYQLINGYKLLYSAVNDSIIEHGIKVYTSSGNLYIDNTNVDDFDEIYVLYNGEYYDLLQGESVNVNGEFILFAKRKTQVDIPTDISIIKDNNEVIKFMHNNNLYIKKNNHTYNILGGIVK